MKSFESGQVSPEQRDLMEALKNSPDYLWYKRQKVNHKKLDGFAFDFEKQAEESGAGEKDIRKARRNLLGLIEDVKREAGNYFDILVTTERQIEISRFRDNSETTARRARDYDQRRRHIHNALIDNIVALTRLINVALPKIGIKIRLDDENWFSRQQLEDRDFIGEWAYKVMKGKKVKDKLDEVKEKQEPQDVAAPAKGEMTGEE